MLELPLFKDGANWGFNYLMLKTQNLPQPNKGQTIYPLPIYIFQLYLMIIEVVIDWMVITKDLLNQIRGRLLGWAKDKEMHDLKCLY